MFFEFGIKDFIDILLAAFLLLYIQVDEGFRLYQGIHRYSGFYTDLVGGDSGFGDEVAGFHLRYFDECGRDSADRTVSGRDTPFLADFGFSPACQCIGPSL